MSPSDGDCHGSTQTLLPITVMENPEQVLKLKLSRKKKYSRKILESDFENLLKCDAFFFSLQNTSLSSLLSPLGDDKVEASSVGDPSVKVSHLLVACIGSASRMCTIQYHSQSSTC